MNPKEEVALIYDKIAITYHDFANQYNKWHGKTSDALDRIRHIEVNSQYKTLTKTEPEKKPQKAKKSKLGSKFAVDYNKFVDDLLKLTPHNQTYPV